jgi:hypothetical protein
MKHVIVTGEFRNLVPAHRRFISKQGTGSHVTVAISRAIDAIFRDERLKHKRATYPMVFTVLEVEENK